MSKIITDIQNRVSKIKALSGLECSLIESLTENASEKEWIDAWNTDQYIIMGTINDIELQCGHIEKEDYN